MGLTHPGAQQAQVAHVALDRRTLKPSVPPALLHPFMQGLQMPGLDARRVLQAEAQFPAQHRKQPEQPGADVATGGVAGGSRRTALALALLESRVAAHQVVEASTPAACSFPVLLPPNADRTWHRTASAGGVPLPSPRGAAPAAPGGPIHGRPAHQCPPLSALASATVNALARPNPCSPKSASPTPGASESGASDSGTTSWPPRRICFSA